MLFNSYDFVFAFLPATLLGYHILSKLAGRKVVVWWLVICSLVYYGWWKAEYLALILASILLNFVLGRCISRRGGGRTGKALLTAGVAVNLSLLGYFKYFNFFVETANSLTGASLQVGRITLPIAVSFFTFQQIAFLVDVWRGETREPGLGEYSLFVTFFPQLIAGPVVHHKETLPQFMRGGASGLRSRDMSIGVTIFVFGLFKKVAIADTMARLASPVFEAAELGVGATFAGAWVAALAYGMQIYFDFSGYSDMAIGLGRLFGIRLPLNFHSPYKAQSIADFWRRWHMTLSRFLRDYLYIPLGGNRKGKPRRYLNVMVTMLLGGLWHGAGWTFVLWGALHGLYLCAGAALSRALGGTEGGSRERSPARRALACGATFLLVVLAWVLFRAETLSGALLIYKGMFGCGGPGIGLSRALAAKGAWLAIPMAACWLLPNTQELMSRFKPALDYDAKYGFSLRSGRRHAWVLWKPDWRWALLTGALGMAAVALFARASEFIYYQF